jgi:hypothetical protein
MNQEIIKKELSEEEKRIKRMEYQREYRKKQVKSYCACGGSYLIDYRSRHFRSNKHKKWEMLLEPEAKYHYERFFQNLLK